MLRKLDADAIGGAIESILMDHRDSCKDNETLSMDITGYEPTSISNIEFVADDRSMLKISLANGDVYVVMVEKRNMMKP